MRAGRIPAGSQAPLNSLCVALAIGIVDFRTALNGDFFLQETASGVELYMSLL